MQLRHDKFRIARWRENPYKDKKYPKNHKIKKHVIPLCVQYTKIYTKKKVQSSTTPGEKLEKNKRRHD